MPNAKFKLKPRPRIIALNDMAGMSELIGTVGCILLDLGRPAEEVIHLMSRAREAAAVDQDLALQILKESGIQLTFHNQYLQ